jgi:hypothetical protein
VSKLHVVSEAPPSVQSLFDEWKRLNRFLESARMAFARERNLCASLGIHAPEQIRLAPPKDHPRYKVTLQEHIDAIGDADTLHASVLLHSYALAENAAANRLAMNARKFGGIEDWGYRLLSAEGRDWINVSGGLAGAVEIAVTRNAFAHGSRTLDAEAQARLHAAGGRPRPVGSRVTLTYAALRKSRARLLSLLSAGGIRR